VLVVLDEGHVRVREPELEKKLDADPRTRGTSRAFVGHVDLMRTPSRASPPRSRSP
jgi:hypothetical protein